MSAVVDRVIPAYGGDVVFVNAITADPSGAALARRFSFQYIPTSFFLTRDGQIADSYTGPMDEPQLRARLDGLVAK